jgi:hypothetical protein
MDETELSAGGRSAPVPLPRSSRSSTPRLRCCSSSQAVVWSLSAWMALARGSGSQRPRSCPSRTRRHGRNLAARRPPRSWRCSGGHVERRAAERTADRGGGLIGIVGEGGWTSACHRSGVQPIESSVGRRGPAVGLVEDGQRGGGLPELAHGVFAGVASCAMHVPRRARGAAPGGDRAPARGDDARVRASGRVGAERDRSCALPARRPDRPGPRRPGPGHRLIHRDRRGHDRHRGRGHDRSLGCGYPSSCSSSISSRIGIPWAPIAGISGFRNVRLASTAPARTAASRNPRRW